MLAAFSFARCSSTRSRLFLNGVSLDTTTNLSSPVAWSAVTNTVTSSNGLFYLFLPATNRTQQYFRLNAP